MCRVSIRGGRWSADGVAGVVGIMKDGSEKIDLQTCSCCGYELSEVTREEHGGKLCPECGSHSSIADERSLISKRQFVLEVIAPWYWAFPIGLVIAVPLGYMLSNSSGLLTLVSLGILAIPPIVATFRSCQRLIRIDKKYRYTVEAGGVSMGFIVLFGGYFVCTTFIWSLIH